MLPRSYKKPIPLSRPFPSFCFENRISVIQEIDQPAAERDIRA